MKTVFTHNIIRTSLVAGIIAVSAANPALAQTPYASWDASRTTDVAIEDSFNRSSSVSEDNDVSSVYSHREDNDTSSVYSNREDNDVHTSVNEDNDITKSWQQSTDVDLQIATPTLTGYKSQHQQAGHQADQSVLGAARGHTVGVTGGPTVVSAGNDEQVFYGPAMVNNNTNQLPQNNLFVQGSNGAPISQSNTFAGRDMGPKGVFAPVGNTSATVFGDTSQRSGAQLGQSGDAGNSIADQMNATVRK